MRDLTPEQQAVLSEDVTAPTFLIDMEFGSQEYLSTRGDIEVDGVLYSGFDAGISSISDWTKGTIKLVPTPERVQTALSSGWQGNKCKIYLLPQTSYPQIYQEGYVEEGYGIQGNQVYDPILLLDGVLDTASFSSSTLNISIIHKAYVGQWAPRLRITNQFANHLPEVGTQFTWEGDIFTLESR